MQVYRLLKDTLFDVIFGEIFRIEGHKKTFLTVGPMGKGNPQWCGNESNKIAGNDRRQYHKSATNMKMLFQS